MFCYFYYLMLDNFSTLLYVDLMIYQIWSVLLFTISQNCYLLSFYSFYSLDILSFNFVFVYYNLDIYFFCFQILSCAYLIFFCFYFKFITSLFIFFGYLYSNAFKLRSIIFFIPFSPLSEIRLPLIAICSSMQFFCNRSMYIFQYFSDIQLSEHFKYLSSPSKLIFSMICINPLSEILHPENYNLQIISPAGDSIKKFINYIIPSSPRRFLLKHKFFNLVKFIMVIKGFIPAELISFAERFRYLRFYIFLFIKLKIFQSKKMPLSPIPLPLKLISSIKEVIAPQNKVQTPYPSNSLNQRLIFLRFLLIQTYFLKVGPIDDLIKFFPISKDSKWIAFKSKYQAPQVFIMFYDIVRYFNCLFFFKGIDSIYAPLIPISLSWRIKVSIDLFCSSTAAKHLAPSIPNEFFLIDPYQIPRLICFKWMFLISSSRIKDSPTSLIILLAKFISYNFVLLIKFLIACIPYSDIELSAKLSQENLYRQLFTDQFIKCQ